MSRDRKLTHVYYKCDDHIVFTPTYRFFQVLEGMVKALVVNDFELISSWKDVQEIELNVQKDHIHLVCSIPPKVSKPEYMGVLKGKMATKSIRLCCQMIGRGSRVLKDKKEFRVLDLGNNAAPFGHLDQPAFFLIFDRNTQCFPQRCSLFRLN
tara:strand:+ start:2435 stop:2893 length:459 start_codon:yes stop_codon:yes gene_type:complete